MITITNYWYTLNGVKKYWFADYLEALLACAADLKKSGLETLPVEKFINKAIVEIETI